MTMLHTHRPLSLPLYPDEIALQRCRHHSPMIATAQLSTGVFIHTIRCDDCGATLVDHWESADYDVAVYEKE